MHNAVPAFCKNGNLGTPVSPTAANTNGQGVGTIGTDIFKFFDADATNGSLVEYVRFNPTATTPTNTTATVARIFWSTQTSGATTSANTHLIAEVALPISAADNASTPVNSIDVPINFRLPAGAALLVTNHAAPAANTGWKTMGVGGDF
ncbi:MAG: hypothetical protein JWM74_4918 [Myxococcaceae bacterium]|nr:hypothetical protein [Myxococcaceae bacterium]